MFYIGIDLGQRKDHTAFAVVERVDRYRQFNQPPEMEFLLVKHAFQVPLETPYPQVVECVRQMVFDPELRGNCSVVVDATGVGIPVVEQLRRAGLGCELSEVTITGGEKESQRGSEWSVPKKDLMAGVQVCLERGELKIARRMRESAALVKELADMKALAGRGAGRMKYGAEGAGQHDDLAIAVALAVWMGRKVKRMNGFGTGRLI